MNNRKKAIIIISLLTAAPLLLFCTVSLYLSDANISGFTGVFGVIRLSNEETYVELTDNPVQLLIRRRDAEGDFEDSYFDSWEDTGYPARGTGMKNDQEYEYSFRSFTSRYFIVTLEKSQTGAD